MTCWQGSCGYAILGLEGPGFGHKWSVKMPSFLQIAITVMHVARLGIHSNGSSVVASLQVLILWLRVQYFAR